MPRQQASVPTEPRPSSIDRAKRHFACSETHRRVSRGAAHRGPWRAQAGAATIESVLAIGAFVIAFAGVMEIVGATFETDRMGRAAQAAARVLALDKTIHGDQDKMKERACEAIRRELQKDATFDCWTTWTRYGIQPNVDPSELPATLDLALDPTGYSGEMVLVRIGWSRDLLSFEQSSDSSVSMVAMGLARAEP